MRPTPFCHAFARQARRVLSEWDSLERFALSGGAEGDPRASDFRMGFCCPFFPGVEKFSSLISIVSSKVLGREVRVDLLEDGESLDALRSGRVGGVISIGQIHADDVVCGSLGTVGCCLLMAPDHPLAAREFVTIEDVSGYPVLYSDHFEHFKSSVLDAYLARGLRSRFVAVNNDEELAAFMAAHGLSFMVAGNLVVPGGGLVTRPMAKEDEVAVPVCLSTLRDSGVMDYKAFRRGLSRLNLF
ncbi:substrate-binding domain-containing protein [Olsenella profusa]|uniref:Substrate-binding domain-containing protein n=2 Tax=Olsenella profusa TaxID=138595 RepID=A0ABS2F2N2_9ACTN|nr:substrate-binding domain-containing protein [Olsenella profusa]